jgi:ABC-2 type transport system ATP-binding protein
VSFTVRRGEVLGLIGPNGAGKTTLFECIAGVLPSDAGSVAVDGVAVPRGTPSPALFYLPDGIAPWPVQRLDWALDFAVGYFGGRPSARREVVERLGLAPLLRSRIGTLVPHPVLMADEPFDGLDLRQTREIAAALREHARGGRTLFLSIHQITDAARVCDRFVLLSGGRVCGVGTLDELAAAVPAGAGGAAPSLEEVVLALT